MKGNSNACNSKRLVHMYFLVSLLVLARPGLICETYAIQLLVFGFFFVFVSFCGLINFLFCPSYIPYITRVLVTTYEQSFEHIYGFPPPSLNLFLKENPADVLSQCTRNETKTTNKKNCGTASNEWNGHSQSCSHRHQYFAANWSRPSMLVCNVGTTSGKMSLIH